MLDAGRAPAPRGGDAAPRRHGARDPGTTSGWIVKIVLLGLVDALAITGLLIALEQEAWGYVAVLAVTLVALNVVYLPRRYVPMKYLLPGLFFLAVFGVYPVLYTAYTSTTNYGTGFVLSRGPGDRPDPEPVGRPGAETSTAYDVTPLRGADGRSPATACSTRRPRSSSSAPTEGIEPLDEPAELQVLTTTGRTFVVSVGDLEGVRPGDVDTLPGYPADPESYVMPGETEGSEIRISGGQAFESRTTREYDPETATITDTSTDPPPSTPRRGAVRRPRTATR